MYCSQLPSSNRAYCSVMLKIGKVNLFFFSFSNQCCTVNAEKSNNISQTPKLLTDRCKVYFSILSVFTTIVLHLVLAKEMQTITRLLNGCKKQTEVALGNTKKVKTLT